MKKIGLVGGLGWLSTVEYYRAICEKSERRHQRSGLEGPSPMPEIAIESLDLCAALASLGTLGVESSWEKFDDYHRRALLRLQAAGAEIAAIASNTPHYRYASICDGVDIPVVDINAAIAAFCLDARIDSVAILGTEVTMRSLRLADALARCEVTSVSPEGSEAASLAAVIADLQHGNGASSASAVERLGNGLLAGTGARSPAICLACTELPLAFPEFSGASLFEWNGARYINTAAVHAEALFAAAEGSSP